MRKYLIGFSVFILAFGILSISVFKTASPKFVFSAPAPTATPTSKPISIDYQLPYPGKILPDNLFWPLKAGRDKIWYTFTFNSEKKAELALLLANKRLLMSKELFEREKPDLAFSTLTKSVKYLETAQTEGKSDDFLTKIATASLKHRQILREIMELAPADAKPEIILLDNKLRNIFKFAKESLNNKGLPAPINPFDGD